LATHLSESQNDTHYENNIQLRHLLHAIEPSLALVRFPEPTMNEDEADEHAQTEPPTISSAPSQSLPQRSAVKKAPNTGKFASSSTPARETSSTPVEQVLPLPSTNQHPTRTTKKTVLDSVRTSSACSSSSSSSSSSSHLTSNTHTASDFYTKITALIKQVSLKKQYPNDVMQIGLALEQEIFNYINYLHSSMPKLPSKDYAIWVGVRDMWVHRAHELSILSLRNKLDLISELVRQLWSLEFFINREPFISSLVIQKIRDTHNTLNHKVPANNIFNTHTRDALCAAVAGVTQCLRLWQTLTTDHAFISPFTGPQILGRLTIVLCKYLRKITDSLELPDKLNLPSQHKIFDYSLRDKGRNLLAHPKLPRTAPETAYNAFQAWNAKAVARMQEFMGTHKIDTLIQAYETLLTMLTEEADTAEFHTIGATASTHANGPTTSSTPVTVIPSTETSVPLTQVPYALFASSSTPSNLSLESSPTPTPGLSAAALSFVPPICMPSSAVAAPDFIPPSNAQPPSVNPKAEEFIPPAWGAK
jgi:hypothetical protein